MNLIYCTCLCYWTPSLVGLEVVEVTVMCLFFWTGALCASLLHSQCPHMCCWCIRLQGYIMTIWILGFIIVPQCVSQHRHILCKEWWWVLLLSVFTKPHKMMSCSDIFLMLNLIGREEVVCLLCELNTSVNITYQYNAMTSIIYSQNSHPAKEVLLLHLQQQKVFDIKN